MMIVMNKKEINKAAQALSRLAYEKQFGDKSPEQISEHMKRVRAGKSPIIKSKPIPTP